MAFPLVHNNLTTIPASYFRQVISMKDDVHDCAEFKIDKREEHIKITSKHMANNSLVMNVPSDETKLYYFEVQLMSANNSIVVGMLPEDVINPQMGKAFPLDIFERRRQGLFQDQQDMLNQQGSIKIDDPCKQ